MTTARDQLPANFPAERVALVDLLDRLLAEGVVVTGDITLSIADIDLVTVSLRALLTSVSTFSDGPAAPDSAGPAEAVDRPGPAGAGREVVQGRVVSEAEPEHHRRGEVRREP